MSTYLKSVSNTTLEQKGLIKLMCERQWVVLLFRTKHFLCILRQWPHGKLLTPLSDPFNNIYLLPHSYLFWEIYPFWKKVRRVLFQVLQEKRSCFPFDVVNIISGGKKPIFSSVKNVLLSITFCILRFYKNYFCNLFNFVLLTPTWIINENILTMHGDLREKT